MTGTELLFCLGGVSSVSVLCGWGLGRRASWSRPSLLSGRRGEDAPARPASLEEILDLLPDPAVLLDSHGSMRFANLEANSAFGDSLVTIVRHPNAFSALRKVDEDTPQVSAVMVLEVPVRRVIRGVFRLLPQNVHAGSPRVLVIMTDCSEQDAVERVRTDFVAYASHELRTPLAALIGFIETLRGPAADDPPVQQQFLGIMASQAARMQRLIERLLELSRVEMTEHKRPRREVDVERVVGRVRDEVVPFCSARDVRLEVEAEPAIIQGDEDQLVQVLLNLVENATKYAGGHGRRPDVSLRVFRAVSGGREGMMFTVEDNGPGIDAHHLPRLTEQFYRVEADCPGAAQGVPGYGLGLAIVRHIVDRHEGVLTIESEPGHGTRCSVWIPMRQEQLRST